MIYTTKIQKAINFAIDTHEKQTRKGKDIPYITHPLTVGLILSRAGADEDTVVAGILHDTIEDSAPEKKVSREILEKNFGKEVAELVSSVTEQNKELSWEDRKQEALLHIKTFSHNSLLLKSADIISNASELIGDYERDGDKTFERFNAPKEKLLQHQLRAITAIIVRWSENPLSEDLKWIAGKLQMMGAFYFMTHNNTKKVVEWSDYNEDIPLVCSVCGWKGTPKSSGWIQYYDALLDVSCPICEKMLLIANYPLIETMEKNTKTKKEEKEEFADNLVKAMVGGLNKKVAEEVEMEVVFVPNANQESTIKAPIKCALWEKPELVKEPMKERFELLETFADESHLFRYLLKCHECGQLYFFEFYEEIDWEHGNDPQYTTWIPIDTPEDAQKLSKLSPLELLQFLPRLQKDFPKDAKIPSLRWVGKQ
ncbi:MAG: HD domain-containing protein [bacterium]|nr:HD domain-containing protein [bacterium]